MFVCSNGARKSYGFVTLETESALQRTVSQHDHMVPTHLLVWVHKKKSESIDVAIWHVLQLAAGSEHVINGRTVRINLAGPRPDQMQQQLGLLQNDYLPQLQGVAWAGQQQQALQQQQQALQAQQAGAWPISPGALSPGTTYMAYCLEHHSLLFSIRKRV